MAYLGDNFIIIDCPTVLERACLKKSLDPAEYVFMHNRKPVNLSTTFRHSGLVNNGCVDLVVDAARRAAAQSNEVRMAFRLPNGQRVLWTGSPKRSIESILNELAATDTGIAELLVEHDASSSDRLELVLMYLQLYLVGKEQFRIATPADLGLLGGSALFQLLRLSPDKIAKDSIWTPSVISTVATTKPELISDAETKPSPVVLPSETINPFPNQIEAVPRMVQQERDDRNSSTIITQSPDQHVIADGSTFVSPYSVFDERPTTSAFGQPDEPKKNSQLPTADQPRDLGSYLGISLDPDPVQSTTPAHFSNFQFPVETAGQDLRQSENTGKTDCHSVDRQCVIYRQASLFNSDSISHEETPDEIFDLTEADIRNLLKSYRREWATQKSLTTTSIRTEREQLFRRYPRAIIRFHWSDGIVLQACFDPREQVSVLYEFIRGQLDPSVETFELYTTPPRTVLKNHSASLIDVNLVPMAKVYFSSNSTKAEEVFSEEILSSANPEQTVSDAMHIVQSWMKDVKPESSEQTSDVTGPELPRKGAMNISSVGPSRKPSDGKRPQWFKLGH